MQIAFFIDSIEDAIAAVIRAFAIRSAAIVSARVVSGTEVTFFTIVGVFRAVTAVSGE